jgi:hypothetical protein
MGPSYYLLTRSPDFKLMVQTSTFKKKIYYFWHLGKPLWLMLILLQTLSLGRRKTPALVPKRPCAGRLDPFRG